MNKIIILVIILACAQAFSQARRIKKGASVYIEPMDGYETYLEAAFIKDRVPLALVSEKVKADYIITGSHEHKDLSGLQPSVVVNNTAVGIGDRIDKSFSREVWEKDNAAQLALGESSVGIRMTDVRSSRIVFACSAEKTGTKQLQKMAADCAKRLKRSLDKGK